jgi:hypothetical protein
MPVHEFCTLAQGLDDESAPAGPVYMYRGIGRCGVGVVLGDDLASAFGALRVAGWRLVDGHRTSGDGPRECVFTLVRDR